MIDIANEFCKSLAGKLNVPVETYNTQQPMLLGVAKWFTETSPTEDEAISKVQDAISHYYKECDCCQRVIIGTCVSSSEQGQYTILVSVMFNFYLRDSKWLRHQ